MMLDLLTPVPGRGPVGPAATPVPKPVRNIVAIPGESAAASWRAAGPMIPWDASPAINRGTSVAGLAKTTLETSGPTPTPTLAPMYCPDAE